MSFSFTHVSTRVVSKYIIRHLSSLQFSSLQFYPAYFFVSAISIVWHSSQSRREYNGIWCPCPRFFTRLIQWHHLNYWQPLHQPLRFQRCICHQACRIPPPPSFCNSLLSINPPKMMTTNIGLFVIACIYLFLLSHTCFPPPPPVIQSAPIISGFQDHFEPHQNIFSTWA